MTASIALRTTKQERGPFSAKPNSWVAAALTEFEMQVARLGLTRAEYARSRELKRWCDVNRNRFYIPEWLLDEWEMAVDPNWTEVA